MNIPINDGVDNETMPIPSWLLFLIILIGGGAVVFILSPPTFIVNWFIRKILGDRTIDENNDGHER